MQHTIEPWNMWNLTTFFESNPILLQSTKQTIKWSEHKRFETTWKWTHHHKITYPTHKLCWIDHFGANQRTFSSTFLYRTNKPQHCIYIIWIWQFPNQSTVNQWFSLKKGWWQRSHEKDVKICSTISSYYLMCNLILLLRKKRLNWITFRIDLNPIHKMADKQSTTTARRRSSSSSTHLITNNE